MIGTLLLSLRFFADMTAARLAPVDTPPPTKRADRSTLRCAEFSGVKIRSTVSEAFVGVVGYLNSGTRRQELLTTVAPYSNVRALACEGKCKMWPMKNPPPWFRETSRLCLGALMGLVFEFGSCSLSRMGMSKVNS